jgi:hypothetical protein
VSREKTSFEKKSPLLDLFSAYQPESKGKPESKNKSKSRDNPESKGMLGKERLFVGRKKSTDGDNQPSSLDVSVSKKGTQTEKVTFMTHTEEISFGNFLKFRPDKKIW